MKSELAKAVREYEAALELIRQHDEAKELLLAEAQRKRQAVTLLDPSHELAGETPQELVTLFGGVDLLGGIHLGGLAAVVAALLDPEGKEISRVERPETVMLAGSIALGQVGPETAPADEIVNRVVHSVRAPTLELER
jgi:hypothetical protein